MTRTVLTVRPQSAVREAAELLSANGFTALPVVDDGGVLIGIITDADILRDRIPKDPRTLLENRAEERSCGVTVGAIMSTPALTMPAGTDLAELAKFMLHKRIRSVPIVDGDYLVGIVTRRDLVGCLARTDAAIATDVRRRLETYGGPGRWHVDVRRGHVAITDSHDDPVDAHVAKIIAQAVPGVEFAKVVAPVEDPGPVVPGPRSRQRRDQRPAG